jgi:Na+-transporting NADH:ubiquinone oxidoreductase subunit C|tara:strand:- start:1134 stop:1805 length:672 start_codon:yes stop_codon:yes gene_type:complete
MREDSKTIIFALGICLVCSVLLSGLAAGLKKIQTANREFDVKRNIVKAFGVDIGVLTKNEIEEKYSTHISKNTIDLDNEIIFGDGKPYSQINVFSWKDDVNAKPSKYAFPIAGKGLWSVLYGYLAIDADIETIVGISFYAHKETPGLGAEIEKAWFQDQFKDKKIYENGQVADFKVTKPGLANNEYSVDGISGSTITSKGVEILLKKDAEIYAKYFFNKLKEI